ncbi:putative epidermis-specific secreted glycoprotein EP1-like [Capsicum annuum]|nr:putative epidermis-specific secreted glycoprotein EP1-like [Capsicum annuum]
MPVSYCSQRENGDHESNNKDERNDSDMLSTLSKEKGWRSEHLYQYKSFWFTSEAVEMVKRAQQYFKAQPTDILLATFPKSGTKWFKALIFSLMSRVRFDFSSHPLLTKGPHDSIPFLEAIIQDEASYQDHRISCSPRRCLLATYIPYSLLPASVTSSGCKIVYVYRETRDVFVSNWHYMKKLRPKQLPSFPIEDAFGLFCKGVSHFGPIWDHVSGYWKAFSS